jgi:hypothetical protein
MTTRNGKIARLPRAIREELNGRLQNGESGQRLAAWLNSLPEVQAVVAKEFEGRPIREQNISEWRKGGYRDWLCQQEALDMVRRVTAEVAQLQQGAAEPLTDKLAPWLVARYFVAARALAAENGAMDWKLMRQLCRDVLALRRGDHNAERLRLERERLQDERAQAAKKVEEQFAEWVADPDVREQICRGFQTHEEAIEALGWRLFGDLWERGEMPQQPDPAAMI